MQGAAQYRPLGSLRFALSLMVVVQHFQHLLPQSQREIFSKSGSGAIAVAAFFTISGFIVAEALATFYAGRPAAFLANRILRLAPPYLAALTLSILVHTILWHTGQLVLWDYTLTTPPTAPARLLSGLLALIPGFNPRWLGADFEFVPYVWSLRLEMAFYAAAAATMWLTWRARSPRPAIAITLAALSLSLAFLLLTHRPSALSTAPMFLVGVAFFLRAQRPRPPATALLAASLAIGALGFASWRQHGAPDLRLQLPVLAAILALFALLIPRTLAGAPKRLDRALGDLSYPLYLNHYVIGIAASSLIPHPGWPLFTACAAAAIGLAALAERAVERPLRALRTKIRKASV